MARSPRCPPINQDSGRLRSSPLGWDGEETCTISNRPREEIISPYIQFRSG
ncbi:MAG: hypothetical protein F6K23_31220 [Okeania sp. SIO2C9]|uniref:hypothetical protein n=1 Tax=Okeania sp. SIO2C9 TaxID=2607791 RepID=UPI0013C159B2|nr:hypothetical protein [Okeania sp. SIO2C9]NEQ77091.1 hypothetical protein [Okeania sp. SIO2C9]